MASQPNTKSYALHKFCKHLHQFDMGPNGFKLAVLIQDSPFQMEADQHTFLFPFSLSDNNHTYVEGTTWVAV